MDHVSEFFKKGFLSLHKNKIEKTYHQKTLRDRMDNFNCMRRETRNTLIFQKRNIDVNMSPINTPEPSKMVKKVVEKKQDKGNNKRLEMLKNWKAEKEKRKQQAKQKAKPVFKVCHVPVEVGLPDLNKVNKEIKGKPIISQFAPANHKFHAPKNVKPISFSNPNSNNSILTKSNKNKNLSEKNTSQSQNGIRITRSQKADMKLKKLNVSSHTQSCTVDTNKKSNVKKVPEQRVALNTHNQKSTGHLQQNSKQSSSLKPNVVNTSYIKKNNRNSTSTSDAKSAKLSTKCSLPKKIKKNDNQKGKENITNHLNSSTMIKTEAAKKLKNESIEINTPTIDVRKTPKKYKIKFKEANNTMVGENEEQINTAKNQDARKKNTSSKTLVKSRKAQGGTSTRNVGWNVIEVMDSDDDKILSKDVNNATPKTSSKKYKKTPRKNGKTYVCDNTATEQVTDTVDVKTHSTPVTPKNRKSESFSMSPVYISPFVTISRGKTSARKEYQVRKSTGTVPVTPEFSKSFSESTSPKAGAEYFSRKLNSEIERIQGICKQWNSYRDGNSVPEEANDMIDVAIGQSNLLLSKKFQQFQSLIDQCRKFEYKEKPITCEDLHGFWDMMFMQVIDLDKRFKNLEDLKANNWEVVIPDKKPVIKRGRGRPKKAAASSSLKDLIKAAREKKRSNDDDETQATVLKNKDSKVFTGGYYSVKSPVRELNLSPLVHPSSTRRSLRVSLLAHQTRRRISSPGLTMMKVTQAIKQGDGLTPSKSILKTEVPKSASRITKCVLFKDDLEEDIDEKLKSMKNEEHSLTNMDADKENNVNDLNLISFSPAQTPTRRSLRLAYCK